MSLVVTAALAFFAEPEVQTSTLLAFLGDPLNATTWLSQGDCVVLLEDFGDYLAGEEIPSFRDGDFIAVTGDYSGASVAVGYRYDTDIQISTLYVRERSQDGAAAAETDALTQIRYLKTKYDKTGGFKVTVLPPGRSQAYVSEIVGVTDVEKGTLEVPVLNNNERVEIHIKNNTCHRPFSIVGLAWDSVISQKTKR